MLPAKPDSVPAYRKSTAPAHLWTYRQLREAGQRPANASHPDGAWPMKYSDGSIGWMWLYDVRQARPYICTTKHRGRHADAAIA